MQSFHDVVLGDVLVAPFVIPAAIPLVIILLLRPFLALIAFDEMFSNPPAALLCVYILLVAIFVAGA